MANGAAGAPFCVLSVRFHFRHTETPCNMFAPLGPGPSMQGYARTWREK